MNYIWDLVIKAEQAGLAKKEINFSAAQIYSPYMELSLPHLNATTVEPEVEINPYYRHYAIFKDLFNVNNKDETALRNTLFDLMIHFLAGIEVMQGMNKREYYQRFILKDIEKGMFGRDLIEKIKLFDREEKAVLAGNLLSLYETGEAIYLLKDTMKKIFKKSFVYANCEEKDELIFYIGQKKSRTTRAKIELIKKLFVPVRFHTEIYWEKHFGIIGLEETMLVDSIALY